MADLVPFLNLEVKNALERLASALHINDLGYSGQSDFEHLAKVCAYFASSTTTPNADLAAALAPLTTVTFASDVQSKSSGDQMTNTIVNLIPSCKAAVARNSILN